MSSYGDTIEFKKDNEVILLLSSSNPKSYRTTYSQPIFDGYRGEYTLDGNQITLNMDLSWHYYLTDEQKSVFSGSLHGVVSDNKQEMTITNGFALDTEALKFVRSK